MLTASAHAIEILRMVGSDVYIDFGTESAAAIGSTYYVFDKDKKKRAIIKLTGRQGLHYLGKVVKGEAESGWSLQLRAVVQKRQVAQATTNTNKDHSAEYLYYKDNWNFAIEALNAILTDARIYLHRRTTNRIMVGMTGEYFRPTSNLGFMDAVVQYQFTSVGVSAFYQFAKHAFADGFAAEAGAAYLSLDAGVSFMGLNEKMTKTAVGTYVGGYYRWFWESFNVSLGGAYWITGLQAKYQTDYGTVGTNVAVGGSTRAHALLGWTF